MSHKTKIKAKGFVIGAFFMIAVLSTSTVQGIAETTKHEPTVTITTEQK